MNNRDGAKKLYKAHKLWLAAGVATTMLFSAQLATQSPVYAAEPTEETQAEQGTLTITLVDKQSATDIGNMTKVGTPITIQAAGGTQWVDDDTNNFSADVLSKIQAALPAGYKLLSFADQTGADFSSPVLIAGQTINARLFVEKTEASVPVKYVDSATDSQVGSTQTVTGTYGDAFDVNSATITDNVPAHYEIDPAKPATAPAHFGDTDVTEATVYVKQQSVDLPVKYVDNDTTIKTTTLTGKSGDDFASNSDALATEMPTGYELDHASALPMYFGDPAVDEVTLYVKRKDITIPVHYIDSDTGKEVNTLNLTDKYDTEFSTRSEEISENVPTNYILDTSKLPDQLPMYFGDPAVSELTFYVKQKNVAIPIVYRDTNTNQLIKWFTLTDKYDTEFSTRSEEIGTNLPAGYSLDTSKLPDQLPMYFGDPAVTSLTFYVKQDSVTIPVYYRDSNTNELIKTVDLTDKYDTEFSTRSEEIGENVPKNYVIDRDRLPEQLPMYFGDPAVSSVTIYLIYTGNTVLPGGGGNGGTTTNPGGNGGTSNPGGTTDPGDNGGTTTPGDNGGSGTTGGNGTGTNGGTTTPTTPTTPAEPTKPEAKPTTKTSQKATKQTTTKATKAEATANKKALPTTGDARANIAVVLGVMVVMGALVGLSLTRRKED